MRTTSMLRDGLSFLQRRAYEEGQKSAGYSFVLALRISWVFSQQFTDYAVAMGVTHFYKSCLSNGHLNAVDVDENIQYPS